MLQLTALAPVTVAIWKWIFTRNFLLTDWCFNWRLGFRSGSPHQSVWTDNIWKTSLECCVSPASWYWHSALGSAHQRNGHFWYLLSGWVSATVGCHCWEQWSSCLNAKWYVSVISLLNLHDLSCSPNIIWVITSETLRWAEHMAYMGGRKRMHAGLAGET